MLNHIPLGCVSLKEEFYLGNNFGERLKNALSNAGYSQKRATEILELSKNAITNYVSGRIPDTLILHKLAKLCSVSMEWLLVGEESFICSVNHKNHSDSLFSCLLGLNSYEIINRIKHCIISSVGDSKTELTNDVLQEKSDFIMSKLEQFIEKEIDFDFIKEPHIISSYMIESEDKTKSSLSTEEMALILQYRLISSDDKEEIDLIIDHKATKEMKKRKEIAATIKTGEEAAAYEARQVPLFGKVAAGLPILATSDQFDLISVPSNIMRADYALIVRGDSMEPNIIDGSMLFAHKQETLENGEIGIIMLDDAVTCKIFYKFNDRIELRSINQKYDPIIITDKDTVSIKIMGKVLREADTYIAGGGEPVNNTRLA